ncbi:hypothetical protein Hdeb2414_s0003g00109461 [Helianthus debilis subsp. tardiflorus]
MNPSWWGTPSTVESKYINTRLSPSWAESPAPASNAESKYTNMRLSPSWVESPTPPRITAEQWASVTNQKQSEPKMTTDIYGNPIQSVPKQERTIDLHGNPLPPVASQRHRSTVAPSPLDPRNCSQTKKVFYAKIVKDSSNGESSWNDDSSEHYSSSVEDVSTSVEDVTTLSSSSSDDGSECESSREVVDSDTNESTSESDTSQILKARRTWSMTSFGMMTRREGTQVMKLIELPLAIINTSRISLHKDKVFHEHNSRGSLC